MNERVQKMFQFPSNGKAHVHPGVCLNPYGKGHPQFQFPSNGKAHVHCWIGFAEVVLYSFQFPSNGKAHVHLFVDDKVGVGGDKSFNSLQTGKHMCTKGQS